jgi:hypothetical protein
MIPSSQYHLTLHSIEAFVKQAAREGRYCSDSERSADEVTSENEEEVMQLQYRDPIQIIQSLPLPPRQVSSQGCSRVFIVKGLCHPLHSTSTS